MTIKELIEELKTFDENLVVVCYGEETSAPSPYVRRFEFDTTYWENMKLFTIPKNTQFVNL